MRRRQHAAAGHHELGVDHVTFVRRNQPALRCFIEVGALDRSAELDVLVKVETVGDVVQPALDFRLAREFLAPAPSLVERFGEEILIDIGFGIEARAWIAVPIPGAADA
jgi:hypothetical protein